MQQSDNVDKESSETFTIEFNAPIVEEVSTSRIVEVFGDSWKKEEENLDSGFDFKTEVKMLNSEANTSFYTQQI